MSSIVYSRHYNMGMFGVEKLHPFDARKYGRAWRIVRRHFGRRLKSRRLTPRRPASRDELLTVHQSSYLQQLRQPAYVARALELPPVGYLPHWLVDLAVLKPMRWATRGTILAAEAALKRGFCVNLGGGFHHARPDGGEGFCVYNDIGIAIRLSRAGGCLRDDQRVVYIDLDAHQGNGVCHTFNEDSSVFIFDMYNREIYPKWDELVQRRIDCNIRLPSGCDDDLYLRQLQDQLPAFLDSASRSQEVGLAIYNAGTDIVVGDPLGNMRVSADGILQRDTFVVDQLRQRRIPTVMLLSGGYTRVSYRLVAASVIQLLNRQP